MLNSFGFFSNIWYIFAEISLLILIIYLIFISKKTFIQNIFIILWAVILIFSIQLLNYIKYILIIMQNKVNFFNTFLYQITLVDISEWLTFSLNLFQVKLLMLFLSTVILLFIIWFYILIYIRFWYTKESKNFLINKEFLILILSNILFSLLVLKANNLFVLWVFLEMVSISSYLLLIISYTIPIQYIYTYFIFNALAGALILWGCSILNLFNVNNFNIYIIDLSSYIFDTEQLYTLNFGILFIILGFFVKLGLFPFHFWAIEVYDYLTTKLFFFFSTINKLVIIFSLFLILRLFMYLNLINVELKYILFSLITFTIILGSITAFNENNFQRFLVLASLPQMGYILFGFFTEASLVITAAVGYLYIYIVTLLFIYLFISILNKKIIYLTDLKNLFNTHREICFALFGLFLSLAGLPPFIGFTAKFLLLQYFTFNNYYIITLIILLSSIISLVYYLRVCLIFFQSNDSKYFNNDYILLLNKNTSRPVRHLWYIFILLGLVCLLSFLLMHNYYLCLLKLLSF